MTALVQVIHPDNHVWTVTRRFAPWQRVIQPVNIPAGDYKRYRFAPPRPRRTPAEWRHERRDQRKSQHDREIRGWQWLYLAPLPLVAGLAGQALEALVVGLQILVWLVLLPFALLEVIALLVCGLVLGALRLTGLARARVDVVCRAAGERILSLSVLTVRGSGTAGQLAKALSDHLWKVQRPFDPYRDPVTVALLSRAGTHVVRHHSVWSPSVPAS
ncbi:hypothetical protein [Amycolatopsis ruanii]|uniref:hypothetical protein n=1 Tax=Amycolatopsis ruanii TaxID=944491 RepID=UPI0013BE9F46|nr:hypothetical protein [Amycolatopsis ruanii]